MKPTVSRGRKSSGRGRKTQQPKRPPRPLFDYVLLVMPRFSERKKRIVTYVALRTVKEFSNFQYELVADARVENHTITVDIKGLRAPELTLPDAGSATFETEFDDLNGTYKLVIRKLHKEVNIFRVSISPEKVVVDQFPEKQFTDLITRIEEW